MSTNKYLCVFWRQTNSISLVNFYTDLALSATIVKPRWISRWISLAQETFFCAYFFKSDSAREIVPGSQEPVTHF